MPALAGCLLKHRTVQRDRAGLGMKATAENPLLDRIARLLVFPYFALVHRYRWYGVENVPTSGPAILAANHQSLLDPILISLAVKRRIVYIGWEYYCNWPILGPVMRLFETVPVDLDAPAPSSTARMLQALEQGRLCGIFPEAGRTFDGLLRDPKPGVALLALRSGAPIIPITIKGAYRAWPRGRRCPLISPISAYFGRPFRANPGLGAQGPNEHELRRNLARKIMLRIADGFRKLGSPDFARACRERLNAPVSAERLEERAPHL
jgi:1-acyl-sn-glycerol-3-phosphate acyltransferase